MAKAKANQRGKHSLRQVRRTGARHPKRAPATPPPRSSADPTPKTRSPSAAASLREIVQPVSQPAAKPDFDEGAEATGKGTGPGPQGAGFGVEG